ncbi:MAG: thymidylate synthase [Gaiellaceae bacterium]
MAQAEHRMDARPQVPEADAGDALEALTFEALYHRDLLHIVNPRGDVGLITLWSPFRTVQRKLHELIGSQSRIAVVANLYGDGMYAMFCNLLYNPQVRHLVAVGEDLGLATCAEIEAFMERGLEDGKMLGKPVKRVPGTERVFPDVPEFDADRLRRTLTFRYFGKLSRAELTDELPQYLGELPALPPDADRLRVDIPDSLDADYSFRPSEVTAHQVVRARPLHCWEELVVRTMRFGRPVQLRKGPRIELLNAKAVVTEPVEEDAEVLGRFGFDLERFKAYQRRILDPELPEGISYTYGNRLRGYFGTDTLDAAVALLREDPESRGAYVSLWDTSADLAEPGRATPCLTTLFFRRSDERLTLTATYRSHNLLWGWLENVYGLMAIQRHVAEQVGMEPGQITVVSNSLGIDPASPRYALARTIEDDWKTDDELDRVSGKYSLREDPTGYFVVSVDRERGLIVAEHRYGGVLVKRYEADRAVTIEREVAADMAVSLVSHAMWLGRELTAKERQLREAR